MKRFYTDSEVKVCQGNSCITAKGSNAELLTVAFVILLLLTGTATLIAASK